MSRWTMMVEIQAEPYCPSCCCDLLSDTTKYRWGVAVCSVCYIHTTYDQMEEIIRILNVVDTNRHVSISKGLLLWAPQGPVKPKSSLLVTGSADPTVTSRSIVDFSPNY
jgi:hypothetical protein